MTTTDDDVSRETSPGPELIVEGKFAIYQTPNGGYHLVYRPSTSEEDHHFEVPAAASAIFQQVMGGASPGGFMGRMLRPILGRG